MHSLLTFLIDDVLIYNLLAPYPSPTGKRNACLMSATPALPPPSGLFSDFDDPVSQKRSLIAINSVVPCIMLVFASLQLYTRIFIIRSVGMDDRKIRVLFNVL